MLSCIELQVRLRIAFWGLLACGAPCLSLDAFPGRPVPSLGCRDGGQTGVAQAGTSRILIDVFEPAFNRSIQREYELDLPELAGSRRPSPLLFTFHGQMGSAKDEIQWNHATGIDKLKETGDFIIVAPQGLDDFIDIDVSDDPLDAANNAVADLGTGWNVGAGGDDSTCRPGDDVTLPDTAYSCYESCVALNQCGYCNWSTCHDDVAFVKSMLVQIATSYCIDLTRIYALGGSNGGMLLYYLAEKMPETFAALVPVYALPLLGYLRLGSHALQETALLEIHDRGDHTIPVAGGMASRAFMAWYYESLAKVVEAWAKMHGCQSNATNLTNFSHVVEPGPDNFQCTERASCRSGRRVISCLYGKPGRHGDLPKGYALGRIVHWFFGQFRRTFVAPWLPRDPAFEKTIYM